MQIEILTPITVASKTLPLKEVRILPVGDIQYGAMGSDVDRLQRYIKWASSNHFYFIGMGDYVDVASPSNRGAISSIKGHLYDSVLQAMDNQMAKHVDDLKEILKPTIGRWLGLIRGHHYWEFGDGTTSDSRLAQYLECPLLGDCGVVILQLKGGHQKVVTAKIWAHHGQGGGQTAAAPLNKLEHVIKTFNADVYLMAHHHKKAATPIPFVDYEVRGGRVRWASRTRYLVATGGFLKGYEMGTTDAMGHPAGSYVEKKMLTPTALGAPVIRIRPRISEGYSAIDINVEV